MEENQEEKSSPSTPLETSPLKQIRTFQGDVADALQRQNESLVSIQQQEASRRSILATPLETGVGKKKFFLLLGTILLLALGAISVWYTYFEYRKETAVPVLETPKNRFFSIDNEEKFSVASSSRLDFITTISSSQASVSGNETRHFVLNITTAEFFKILDTRAPGSLMRAFDSNFMFGAFGKSTFLIVKLISFENAFAGMLAWEKDMAQDIGPLFTTASLLRDTVSPPVFIDITDRNKDIRLLEVGEESVLVYSFFDNNMLIITDNIETLRVLVERLTRAKLSR